MKIVPVANMFPPRIRTLLTTAAAIEWRKPPGESKERTLALDEAIRLAKRECPHLFRHNEE